MTDRFKMVLKIKHKINRWKAEAGIMGSWYRYVDRREGNDFSMSHCFIIPRCSR